MLNDAEWVAASPSSIYRVLKAEGLLEPWNRKPSKKESGFVQPLQAHEHWHIDIAYLNLGGTFFYLCSILEGYSRAIVHWDLQAAMTEGDVERVVQRARERYPQARPRIISDNGPQFITAQDSLNFPGSLLATR
jgi:transposase InsO family protein